MYSAWVKSISENTPSGIVSRIVYPTNRTFAPAGNKIRSHFGQSATMYQLFGRQVLPPFADVMPNSYQPSAAGVGMVSGISALREPATRTTPSPSSQLTCVPTGPVPV